MDGNGLNCCQIFVIDFENANCLTVDLDVKKSFNFMLNDIMFIYMQLLIYELLVLTIVIVNFKAI